MSRWTLLALVPTTVMIGAASDHDERAPLAAPSQPAVELKTIESRSAAEAPALEMPAQRRPARPGEPLDAFETRSWYVPPPPPPPTAPAPPPQVLPPSAPPLPFTFLGQYQEDDRQVILLMKGERMLLVKAGDVIDGTYQVEGIAGRQLTLLYMPLGIRQTLDVETPG